ncbi:MAG: hypothetical protein H6Q14_2285 [Bacteroidetes bacterium]|nr:hypothetical protein [Bacteroidota bacterium]
MSQNPFISKFYPQARSKIRPFLLAALCRNKILVKTIFVTSMRFNKQLQRCSSKKILDER